MFDKLRTALARRMHASGESASSTSTLWREPSNGISSACTRLRREPEVRFDPFRCWGMPSGERMPHVRPTLAGVNRNIRQGRRHPTATSRHELVTAIGREEGR